MNDNTKAAPQGVAGEDKNYPFYELRYIMRVLSHQGGAPEQDWQTAYGMAKAIFARWHKDQIALAQTEQAAPRMGAAVTDAPLQAGMSNPELYAAWEKKLPGVKPTDEQISAFAIGVEVGFSRATPAAVTDAALIQEIEYGRDHGWPLETLKRLEAMAAACKARAALAASATPGSGEPVGEVSTDGGIDWVLDGPGDWEPGTKVYLHPPAASAGDALTEDRIDAMLGTQVWFDRKDVTRLLTQSASGADGGGK